MLTLNLQEFADNQVTVRVSGSLTIGKDTTQARELLTGLVERYRVTILDFVGMSRIDSTGVGVLVGAHAAATAKGHVLQTVNVFGRVREVLLLVKLLTVFQPDGNIHAKAA